MTSRVFLILISAIMSAHIVIAADTLPCEEERINLGICVGANALTCSLSCGASEINFEGWTAECESITDYCGLQNCCPECAVETVSFKDCILPATCDGTCAPVAPSVPAPTLPLSPSFNFTDGESICPDELDAVTSCIFSNVFTCGIACAEVSLDLNSTDEICENLDVYCNALSCCPDCNDAYKTLANCATTAQGCSSNCDNVAPITTPPVAPTPSAPILPLAPSFNFTDEGSVCPDELDAVALCIFSNAFTCGIACAEVSLDLNSTDGICDNLDVYCNALSCCPDCNDVYKTFANCATSAQACSSNCDNVAPITPAPAPAEPSGPCDVELQTFGACLQSNLVSCLIPCANIFNSTDTQTDDVIVCSEIGDACIEAACCPECEADAKAVVNCFAQDEGCGTTCDGGTPTVISPVAPTPVGAPVVSPAPMESPGGSTPVDPSTPPMMGSGPSVVPSGSSLPSLAPSSSTGGSGASSNGGLVIFVAGIVSLVAFLWM